METHPQSGGDSKGGELKAPGDPGRRGFNRHPVLATILAIIVIAGACIAMYMEMRPAPPEPPPRAFYTTDDGASLFIDDAERLPPFEHDGKKAVRARVFSCDQGKTRFVAYLQMLPEEPLKQLMAKARDPRSIDDDEVAAQYGWLAKRPGEKEWVNSKTDPAKYSQVTQVSCPAGGSPQMVFPGSR